MFQFGSMFGREIPCFPPLVRTFNDENGGNSPNITEIVAACALTGCNPTCPRAGGTCVKYTVTNRNKDRTVAWESHFCGEGIKWDGTVISGSKCYEENNVVGRDHSACFCNNMSKCNDSTQLTPTLCNVFSVILFILFLR